MRRRHISPIQRRVLREAWRSACAYCGKRTRWLQPDHVEPLSHGGDDTRENIVPACVRCNARKSNLLLLEWVCVEGGLLRGRTQKTLAAALGATRGALFDTPPDDLGATT